MTSSPSTSPSKEEAPKVGPELATDNTKKPETVAPAAPASTDKK